MAADDQLADHSEPDAIATPVPATVLLVEDNAIIALDAEETLRSLGVGVVITAASPAQALAAIATEQPTFAVIDVKLGVDSGFTVADTLTGANIPFAFASGYIDEIAFPARFANAPKISKPYTPAMLRAALTGRLEFRTRSNATSSDQAGNGRDHEQDNE